MEERITRKAFDLPGGPHGVLLIHGFTGSPDNMRPMGEALQAQGHTVSALLLQGHGTRIEDMRTQGGHAQWLSCALAAYDALAARCQRVSVIGHSMGGVLALLLAQQRPVYHLVCVAACMRLTNRLAKLSPWVGWLVPFQNHPPRPRDGQYLTDYDTGYPNVPVCRVGDLLRLVRDAERNLGKVTCPVLIVEAGLDETVRPQGTAVIEQGVSSTEKRVLRLPNSMHMCVIGPEREPLFAACAAFLADT